MISIREEVGNNQESKGSKRGEGCEASRTVCPDWQHSGEGKGVKQDGDLAGPRRDVESNEEVIATGAGRRAEQYAQANHTVGEYK